MKNEKFLKMLSGIDSELVENARKDIAVWEESREGVSVQPAPRKPRWKTVAASAAGIAAVAVGAIVLTSNIGRFDGQYGPGAAKEESAVTDNPESVAANGSAENETSLSEQASPWKNAQLPKITAAVMRWDSDLVYDVLGNGYPYIVEEQPDEHYPDDIQTLWTKEYEDGRNVMHLGVGPSSISYFPPEGGKSYTLFYSAHDIEYIDPHIKYSDVLDGFSKEDAIQRAKETAEKLGITNLGEPIVYAMTAEDANAYFDYEWQSHKLADEKYKDDPDHIKLTEDAKPEQWTKDDEAYFIKFPLVYGGIPLETSDVALEKDVEGWGYFAGARIQVVVTRDDIVIFDGWDITTPEYTVGDPVKINFTGEEILNKVNSENPLNNPPNMVNYYGCELVYVPVDKIDNNEWVFAPAWRVDCGTIHEFEDFLDGVTRTWEWHDTIIYNAETGDRIKFDWEL